MIVGESMGAATALQYAALPGSSKDVDAIIADCSFSDMEEELVARLAAYHIPRVFSFPVQFVLGHLSKRLRGFSLKDASPQRAVLASSLPVLFIHGADDTYVPARMSEKMAEQRKRKGTAATGLLIVEGARHAMSVLVNSEAWFSTAFGFIDEHPHGRLLITSQDTCQLLPPVPWAVGFRLASLVCHCIREAVPCLR
ncbi:hypothetical protein MASR2M78_25400 [Treponema sp.]